MHSDLIAERDRAETEIECYPEIDQPDVNVETVLDDKGIADDVYEKSRYAEPYEDGRFAKIKESQLFFNRWVKDDDWRKIISPTGTWKTETSKVSKQEGPVR